MADSAMNQDVESSRVLLKLSGDETAKVSWESLPEPSRLPQGDFIRLLEIKPSEGNYLSIDIRVHRLWNSPEFTALSYV